MLLSMFVLIFVDHCEGNAGVDTPARSSCCQVALVSITYSVYISFTGLHCRKPPRQAQRGGFLAKNDTKDFKTLIMHVKEMPPVW